MTPGGWITMILSVGSVVSLFVWCIVKVATSPKEPDAMHGFEFETPDEESEHERD